jgi:predicted transcriptional regulator of viral defense system
MRFHGLTTQSPAEVWIALPEKARRPRLDYPRLRVARFSGAALTEGIEEHRVEGVDIRVYSPAKTVADAFKYRNKVGIDVAVEALRDFTRRYRGGVNELARFARICRVSRVMQPYLDSIA